MDGARKHLWKIFCQIEPPSRVSYAGGMSATRQQAIQIVYALLYGTSRDAYRRLAVAVPPRLVANLRRLLDDDVARARTGRDRDEVLSMAFYDELPTGSGHQVEYVPYRVFALAIAHELTRFGCKQREVVDFIADSHSELKAAFDHANKQLQTRGRSRFFASTADNLELDSMERPDRLKIYLAVRRIEATESAISYFGNAVQVGDRLTTKEILYGPAQLQDYLSEELADGLFGVFVMELSELAVRITELLAQAPVRKRGRKPSKPPCDWGEAVAQSQARETDDDR